jgi:MFS family permease
VVFDKDGYGSLGFYSNAMDYIAQGTGSVFCVFIMEKIGDIKSMAYSSCICLPFLACLIFPALKSENLNSNNFFLSKGFVFPVILITSLANGFGEGIAQPASGKFIADCATENTKGFYFAFFWSFYMGSQVFGNLIAAFVLGDLD